MPRVSLVVLVVAVFLGLACATTSRADAQLKSLPGLTFTPNFDQYSGYMTLTNTTKNIFYWFFTSQSSNPTNDPVVLWLQGGPGCSDLGGGLFLENGPYLPFVTDFDTKSVNLTFNPYSWNKVANVIYVESPCGVGFSYGEVPSDKTNSDNGTAIDNYVFLQQFFSMYSEFATNDFWITGESYAGIYITTLTYEILTNTSAPQLQSNLKNGGIMLGNPVTNCGGEEYSGAGRVLDMDIKVNQFYWHGMVSRRNYDNWNTNLCNTATPPHVGKCYSIYSEISAGAGHLVQPLLEMDDRSDFSERAPRRMHRAAVQPPGSINPDMLYYSYCTGNGTIDFLTEINPGCFNLDDQVSAYLNNPVVQSAIHAQPTDWSICGGILYNKSKESVIPHLEYFFQNAPTMEVLYYAGDLDLATVPLPQTQRCLETMNRPITSPWRPWIVNTEIAGYVEIYDSYTFATIKAAGHEAPEFQPASSYLLFTSFLTGTPLPGK